MLISVILFLQLCVQLVSKFYAEMFLNYFFETSSNTFVVQRKPHSIEMYARLDYAMYATSFKLLSF